jgi:hypothetical protein
MVWETEGIRIIQRKGMGREEGKGREGRKEGRKEEDDFSSPKKFLDPPLD